MSSIAEGVSGTNSKIGHRRRPSIGKDLPIASLVINITKPKNNYDSLSRDGTSPDFRNPGIYFKLNDVDEEDLHHIKIPSKNRKSFMSSMLHKKNDQFHIDEFTDTEHEIFYDNSTISDVDDDDNVDEDEEDDESALDKETEELRENFNITEIKKKLAVAEALAKASMLTSPAVKRRLAARKVEMDLEAGSSAPFQDQNGNEYEPPRELLIYLVR